MTPPMMPTTAKITARVIPIMAPVLSLCWSLFAKLELFPDSGDASLPDECVGNVNPVEVARAVAGSPSIEYEMDCVGCGAPAADMMPFAVAVDN